MQGIRFNLEIFQFYLKYQIFLEKQATYPLGKMCLRWVTASFILYLFVELNYGRYFSIYFNIYYCIFTLMAVMSTYII